MNIDKAQKQLSEIAKQYVKKPALGYNRREKDKLYLMLTKEEAAKADWVPKAVLDFPVIVRIMGTAINFQFA